MAACEECGHDDGEHFLEAMNESLGFCECGDPDGNALYVLGGLKLLNNMDKIREYDQWVSESIAHHGSEKAWHFFLYWATAVGLAEHGGSVTSSWLSGTGREVVERLEKAKALAEAAEAQGELCL